MPMPDLGDGSVEAYLEQVYADMDAQKVLYDRRAALGVRPPRVDDYGWPEVGQPVEGWENSGGAMHWQPSGEEDTDEWGAGS